MAAQRRRKAALQYVRNAPARGGERRRQSDPDTRRHRDRGHEQADRGIDPRIHFERHGRRRGDGLGGPHEQPGKEDAGDAAGQGEHHALGQQLADQTPAAGPDRETEGHLPPPVLGARNQQPGQVGAGQGEHQRHQQAVEAHDQPELPRGEPPDAAGVEQRHLPSLAAYLVVDAGRRRVPAAGHGVESRFGGGRRHPAREPRHHLKPVRLRVAQDVALQFRRGGPAGRDRKEDVRRIHRKDAAKPVRGDADDRRGPAVDVERSSNGFGVGVQAAPPEPAADHDHRLRSDPFGLRAEEASGGGNDAQNREVVGRHEMTEYARSARFRIRAVLEGHVERRRTDVRRRRLERLEFPESFEGRIRKGLAGGDQFMRRARAGQRPQHHRVELREEERADADAHGQGRCADQRHAGTLAQHPQAETHVLEQRFDPRPEPGVPNVLPDRLGVAQFDARLPQRRRPRQPAFLQFVGAHLNVELQFGVDFARVPLPGDEPAAKGSPHVAPPPLGREEHRARPGKAATAPRPSSTSSISK